MEIPAELLLGPYDGRTGMLTFTAEPPKRLDFDLDDKDGTASGLIIGSKTHGELTAVYLLVDEKPRKVITYDEQGRARSAKGVRYRYSRELSPCERAFERADRSALLSAEAVEQVRNTRKLLLEEAARRREGASS